jgi:hypothetical protein
VHDRLPILDLARLAGLLVADGTGNRDRALNMTRSAQETAAEAAHRRTSLVAPIVYVQRHTVQIKNPCVPIALTPSQCSSPSHPEHLHVTTSASGLVKPCRSSQI